MTVLLTQIFLCLVLAALIGAVAAWLLRRNLALGREEIIQQDWKERVRQIELERDRSIQKLSGEIDGLNRAASQTGQGVALADYENLAAKLEGQVTEREVTIAELRSEINSLRAELSEARTASRQRETELLEETEQEIANLKAQLQQRDQQLSDEHESELRQHYEQQIAGLTRKLEHDGQASDERERVLLQQHEQKLIELTTQSEDRDDRLWAERENALRQEHQQEIARLTEQLEKRDEQDWTKREQALYQEHEQEIARLTQQLENRYEQDWTRREAALRQTHQQELAHLKAEMQQQANQTFITPDTRIEELAAEIRLRDDSIAVLRDDLAAFNEQRTAGQRGRQDDALRSAMDEALAWQQKYEAVVAELARRDGSEADPAEQTAAVSYPEPVSSTKQRERATGDRIGSVLSHRGGPKDHLQEIKGIGPVLERKLNDIGIYHFKQIAEFDADDIARVSNELGRFTNRIQRDEWVRQATTLHHKYHD